jgi:transposase
MISRAGSCAILRRVVHRAVMARRHGKPKELEQLRLVAARMFEMDRPTKEIATAVGRDEQTIRAWRRAWRASGVDGLRAKPHPGRTPKLSAEQWQEVLSMLLRSPREFGYADAYLGTTTLMARLIWDQLGVAFHHDYVGEQLHRLGWSCQRPAKRAKERDGAAIQHWRDVTWPDLLKKAATAAP